MQEQPEGTDASGGAPTPPLPYAAPPMPVAGAAAGSAATPLPSWGIERTEFAFDATRWQMPFVPFVVRRAPHRRGTIALHDTGLVLEGPAADPTGRLTRIASWLSWAWVFLFFVRPTRYLIGKYTGGSAPPWMFWVLLTAYGGTFFGSIVLSLIAEYRRAPLRLEVPWDRIRQTQFDRTGKVAILVYEASSPRFRAKPTYLALPMRLSDASTAGELRQALTRRAPDRVVDSDPRAYWNRGRATVAILIAVGFVAFLIWVFTTIGKP